MTPVQQQIIQKTISFVQETLKNAEAGHDWWHICRVLNTTRLIARSEEGSNLFICELAALLHDIADKKFHNGDTSIGPRIASEFLESLNVDQVSIDQVCFVISNLGFSESLSRNDNAQQIETKRQPSCMKELHIVQDADRLDALGAIGIARAFHYGGFKNRLLYDPQVPPINDIDADAYNNSTAPTLNHFYEKLFKLKDLMNTEMGKRLAIERHDFMKGYVEQFLAEWNATIN